MKTIERLFINVMSTVWAPIICAFVAVSVSFPLGFVIRSLGGSQLAALLPMLPIIAVFYIYGHRIHVWAFYQKYPKK